jgi:hypothetical protein
MQDVVRPAQLPHDVEISRVAFMRHFQVLQRILHIPGFDAALRHDLGVDRRRRGSRSRAQHLRHPQDSANAVGKIVILPSQYTVKQRRGGDLLATGVQQKTQLRGGEQVFRRTAAQDAKLSFRLFSAAHAQEEVAQLPPQIVIVGV